MDRYRGSRRSPAPRDRPTRDPEVFTIGSGESYRPGGENSYRPSPRDRDRFGADSWTADRRDVRRDDRRDDRREDIDSYVPLTSSRATRPRSRSPAFRRRSRTPPNRREDLFAIRRSPPRRYSPRRSPPRRRSRSPPGGRARSPPDPKRLRDFSPEPSRRSPKRERRFSPDRSRDPRDRSPLRDPGRGGESYRPRSRSPPRRRTQNDTWVRRSPSPRDSGPASHDTSRRSSPPLHPDRASLAGSVTRSPAPPANRSQYDRAESAAGSYRDRSPPPPAPADPIRDQDLSTPRDDVHMNGTNEPRQPPSGPSSYRNGNYERPPPTGPSRSFSQPIQSPPTGPAASMSMSAHNRGGGAPTLRAPSGPRGVVGRFDGPPPRDFPGPRGRGGLPYRGPAPYGPRGGGYGRGDFGGPSSRGDYGGNTYRGGGFGRGGGPVGGGDSSFPFRGNNSSSTTYPRTQRFSTVQQHLATNEKIVPGGKLLPSGLPPDQEKRIKMLEAETERMRAEISEKQKFKREVLNEWEVRERESEREALRSDLAEQHLQQLMESDDGIGRAAF
ncbi:hypothetical protein PV04_08468 [Phialophora macrospora]|uniref:Uncharacterized protein n=1 Tax=Phialophora macrospora TaxID=1851006 RepID=A0A0D2G2D2_9EURO|nr:hypothetical protein PV04_08468 [Phialophora macrospora]